jgi:hypothetical protein
MQQKVRRTLVLLLVAGVAAAAPRLFTPSPDLCFAAGSVTYRLAAGDGTADYAVAIDNAAVHPDLRIHLVDQIETADFALVDDVGAATGNACASLGPIRTVRIVPAGGAADITIAVSRQPGPNDFSLYVHSTRASHVGAAALFALMRQAPDLVLDGAPDQVAFR